MFTYSIEIRGKFSNSTQVRMEDTNECNFEIAYFVSSIYCSRDSWRRFW